MSKRVLILATDGYEHSELIELKKALEQAGVETVVASPTHGENTSIIRGWNHSEWGEEMRVDAGLGEVAAEDFDALLLPGGVMNTDKLRQEERVIELIEDFDEAGKPIAAISHGPWLLVEADIVDDRSITGWPSIRTDLENAGGDVVDEEVVVDGNLITSRKPDDIPAFLKTLIDAVSG
jgi:protease I